MKWQGQFREFGVGYKEASQDESMGVIVQALETAFI